MSITVDKNILSQYTSLVEEADELQYKIDKLETQIKRLENDGIVKDKVLGGEGGIQSFTIEGYQNSKITEKKNLLFIRKLNLESDERRIDEMIIAVEEFIRQIDDSFIRRIINLRFVERMSWRSVADMLGYEYTEDSVRMSFERFMKKL